MRVFLFLILYGITFQVIAQKGNGDPELINAVKAGEINTIKELIDKGAAVNAADSNGATALLWAAGIGNSEMVKYFVSKGASLNINGVIYTNTERTSYYGNLTGIAAGEGHLNVLKYLIDSCKISVDDKEYDPESKQKNGWTALQWAAAAGKKEAVEYLLDKGADINASHTSDKGTPLLYAIQSGHTLTAELLINKGADVNKANNNNTTPLMAAVEANNITVCILLWKNKAGLQTKNNEDNTALDIALDKKYYRIIEFLSTPGNYEAVLKKEYWAELNDSLNYYSNQKEYERAVTVGKRALAAAKKEFGIKHDNYGSTLKSLSVVCRQAGRYELAAQNAEEAAVFYKGYAGKTSVAYASILNQLGLNYNALRDTAKSIKNYKLALEILRLPGNQDNLLESVLYNMSSFYADNKQYRTALPLLKEMIQLQEEIYGRESADYLDGLSRLANAYKGSGSIDEALGVRKLKASLSKKMFGDSTVKYATELNQIAMLYEKINDTANAEAYYKESIDVLRGHRPVNELLIQVINNLADYYERINRFDDALLYSRENYGYIELLKGANAELLASNCNRQARLYEQLSKYTLAEPLYIQALEIRKIVFGEMHPSYANSLNNLGGIYLSMNNFSKAKPLLEEALNIRKKLLGAEHPKYAESLTNLAVLYDDMGNYTQAESLYMEALIICKRTLGTEHQDYATNLNNMAGLYLRMGNYGKAELLYLETLNIRKKLFGEEHPEFAASLNNLASLYDDMGNYAKAEPLYVEALNIRKKVLGKEHPSYATGLNNLAELYRNLGNYTNAEPLYLEALNIRKKIFGTEHSSFASSLNNLALLYKSIRNYSKAEPLLVEANRLYKKILGEEHPSYATSVNNLAALYDDMGNYVKAEPLCLEALNIRKKVLGSEHPEYAQSLNNLGVLYQNMNNYGKSAPLFLRSSAIRLKHMLTNFTNLSEKEKQAWLDEKGYVNESILSVQYKNNFLADTARQFILNQQLLLKSLILSDSKNILQVLQKSSDSSVQKTYRDWTAIKKQLSQQYSLPIAKRSSELSNWEKLAEELEKQLNTKSSAFRQQQQSLRIKTTDVQKGLKQEEVSVEFVRFQLYNKKWTDSIIYAAYILTAKDSIPIFVPLCEEKQLQKLFDSAGATANAMVSKFYRGLELGNTGTAASLGKDLYNLVWAPLEPYLKGIKKISYSPAGKLYSIAFQALPVDSNKILMDKYELNQYTSTRQVALRKEQETNSKIQSITLFGDARFTIDSTIIAQSKTNNTVSNIYTPPNRGNRGSTWTDLPGTAEEVKKIKQLFEQNQSAGQAGKISTKSFTQAAASEENLKALSGNSPQILHIATHGFFLPEPDKKKKDNISGNGNSYSLADDPLMRSGLILSGGNHAWSGKAPIEGVEDGIATAYEISQLNLSNTELVVLSACETALGDVKGSEGVFGLQRAFKMAGVKKMIVSLWQVPDKETAELMTSFYNYWLKGKTIEQAFAQAQAEMRKKYSSYYWAAFVLVE